MVLERVDSGGQIMLPADVQRAAGLAPGDMVSIDVTDRGTVEIRRIHPLRFAEALRRYRIEVPIDEAADRESWQDVAARDVLGQSEDA